MSCLTKEDLINSLKNHKALFRFSDSDTVEQLVERLDYIQKYFVKDVKGYKLIDSDVGVNKSVSEDAQKKDKRKNKTYVVECSSGWSGVSHYSDFQHTVCERQTADRKHLRTVEQSGTNITERSET